MLENQGCLYIGTRSKRRGIKSSSCEKGAVTSRAALIFLSFAVVSATTIHIHERQTSCAMKDEEERLIQKQMEGILTPMS